VDGVLGNNNIQGLWAQHFICKINIMSFNNGKSSIIFFVVIVIAAILGSVVSEKLNGGIPGVIGIIVVAIVIGIIGNLIIRQLEKKTLLRDMEAQKREEQSDSTNVG
jgi:hypothetical protein